MHDIHLVLKIWLSPVGTLHLNHLDHPNLSHWWEEECLHERDKVKVRMQQLHTKIRCRPFPWVCRIHLVCIVKLWMVQDIGAPSSNLTLSPLWNSVQVLNLLSYIHHAIVCAGIIIWTPLCSSSVIDGRFQWLCQCPQNFRSCLICRTRRSDKDMLEENPDMRYVASRRSNGNTGSMPCRR